jgi:ribosome-binding protein aMBF1 (putative translation factor)
MDSSKPHQDWEQVILVKPKTTSSNTSGKPNPPQHKKSIALDGDEIVAPPKPSQELKKAIQQARMAKKMGQKQLAASMNVPIQTIVSYENGKAVPSNGFIAKLETKLQVKLPRPSKKK